ncbi:MAG: (Fe-S)-binding protein [Bacteroidales bacterium]|nr:(Fe-S)-binding protein [Bacteroidales bacterium]
MNIHYDPFVLPFFLGVLFWLTLFVWRIFSWIDEIPTGDRRQVWFNLFSRKLFLAFELIFLESLLHRRIFQKNILLGYMHMSIAFGWFMLIVVGSIESKFGQHEVFNMPWDPVFFNYFEPQRVIESFGWIFHLLMDFFLLMVLSGVLLAIIKRFRSHWFGLPRNTRLPLFDKVALYSLWLIFPARFWVESLNAANHQNGGFLTQPCGDWLATFLPVQSLEYPSWWAYSIVLGMFFVALPFSRYMHIVTEPFLIFFRTLGARPLEEYSGLRKMEVYACSRCGICIEACQLHQDAAIHGMQASYLIQSIRYGFSFKNELKLCLQCGRCTLACPVEIELVSMRHMARVNTYPSFELSLQRLRDNNDILPTHVMYFAGCMTRLSPSIIRSFLFLLDRAGITYDYLDEKGGMCCGKPQLQLGQKNLARQIIEQNKSIFLQHPSMVLVTTCPICLNIFRCEYHLPKHVMHHSELLAMLIEAGRLPKLKGQRKVMYHDSCELAFHLQITTQPREVLRSCVNLQNHNPGREHWCCGGSTASLNLPYEKRQQLALKTIRRLINNETEVLATACPLCKITFKSGQLVPVQDIAEIYAQELRSTTTSKDFHPSFDVDSVKYGVKIY